MKKNPVSQWGRPTSVLLLGLSIVGACIAPSVVLADVRLPHVFGSHMVLQRDEPVPIWGWADAGEEIFVSFGDQTVGATADEDRKWRVKLPAMKACAEGKTLIIATDAGLENVVAKFENVVVGDVWICSGQSNMEFGLAGVLNAQEEIAAADFPMIRHINIARKASDVPLDDVSGQWQVCSPGTAGGFTAVGFFFARKLHKELNVPIGLIKASWGGTRIEPWTPPVGFRQVPQLKEIADRVSAADPSTETGRVAYVTAIENTKKWIPQAEKAVQDGRAPPPMPLLPSVESSHQDPTRIYNAMIHPLIPFAIRGAIWYQGESNGSEGMTYFYKMKALIEGWRKLWGQGDFPFYFVQLANWKTSPDSPKGGDGWARLREAQMKSLTFPNTGMAVIIDIGKADDIHPRNKQDAGDRLALWALAKEYGKKDVVCSGPLYKFFTVEEGKIRIHFDYVGSGLMVGKKEGLAPAVEDKDSRLKGFAVAGADKKWHWAEAKIEGDTVVVSSDKVTNPVAVRYAFRMNPEGCNLYNKEGLPTSPFRTDSW